MSKVKVVLRKDWLILRRNPFFLLMFTVFPLVIMSSFLSLEASLEAHIQPEKHNLESNKPNTFKRVIFSDQIREDKRTKTLVYGFRHVEQIKELIQRKPDFDEQLRNRKKERCGSDRFFYGY